MNNDIVQLKRPNDYFIQLDIEFARAYGVNVAIIAGKLLRLLDNWRGMIDNDGKKWVRVALDEWETELPLKRRTIQRAINTAKKLGIIEIRTFKGRSIWYRINDKFVSGQNVHSEWTKCPLRMDKMSTPNGQNVHLPISNPISNPTFKREGAKKTAPVPTPKNHLAIDIYISEFAYNINRRVRPDIIAAVGDIPAELELWRDVVHNWKLHGYSPKNFSGMLDWFEQAKHGVVPWEYKPKGKGVRNGNTGGLSDAEWDAETRRFDEACAAKAIHV